MKLIIAEKPSVARDIASVLGASNKKNGYIEGNGYRVTWCYGHLVRLSYPESYNPEYKKWNLSQLPILPDKLLTETNPSGEDQFNVVKNLLNDKDTTEIINATDAGREGELIFRLVYNQSNCKKPFKRLWISSMTDEAIREGFNTLQDGSKYENLFNSALARAEADWYVGLNGTRLYTSKFGGKEVLSVGRVQTPVLAMIVERQNEISNFKSKPFYELNADFGDYIGVWIAEDGNRRFDRKEDISRLIEHSERSGIVNSVEKKNLSKKPPHLYDLTLLQREMNRKYKYSAAQTLDAAQSLYEKHKVTSYPRTDSNYLSDDMISQLPIILSKVKSVAYEEFIESLLANNLNTKFSVDNSKVTDHHAIIPTGRIPDFKQMSEVEKNVYMMVLKRFVTIFMPVHEYQETIIKTVVDKEQFFTKGTVIIKNGWMDLEGKDSNESSEDNQILPNLSEGDNRTVKDFKIIEKKTTAPKAFNDDTILSAMENCGKNIDSDELKDILKEKGLGTSATRAGILEKLIEVGYIERSKNTFMATEKGIKLIEVVDPKIKSVELTGEWEYKLNLISKGNIEKAVFIDGIKAFTKDLVESVIKNESTVDFRSAPIEKEIIGVCPRCGKNVYESDKSFSCDGYKSDPKCSFSLWKENKWFDTRGKKLTKTIAKQLLKSGKSSPIKFKKKAGGEYEAHVILKDDGKFVNFDMEFANKKG